jgi:hypothetical protein
MALVAGDLAPLGGPKKTGDVLDVACFLARRVDGRAA